MKKYQLIRELIDYVEAFESQQPQTTEQTVFNFVTWMNQRLVTNYQEADQPVEPNSHRVESPDILLGIMIGFLYRYSRVYAKKGLENTPLVTYDDFTYLATLWQHQPMTKVALIEQNIHEKTTGTEIIRRLLNNDLVEQYDDETDKRSKRLKLTDKGHKLLLSMFPVMTQVATLMGGNLTLPEKMLLVGLLQKLHTFHNPIFLHEREESLSILLKDNLSI